MSISILLGVWGGEKIVAIFAPLQKTSTAYDASPRQGIQTQDADPKMEDADSLAFNSTGRCHDKDVNRRKAFLARLAQAVK